MRSQLADRLIHELLICCLPDENKTIALAVYNGVRSNAWETDDDARTRRWGLDKRRELLEAERCARLARTGRDTVT
jgi:hypothetical protein